MELILVLVVVAIVLAIVAPSMRGLAQSRETADAAVRVVAMAHRARSQAMAQGRPYRLNLDPTGRRCWLTVQKGAGYAPADDWLARAYTPPEDVSVTLESTWTEAGAAYVQFYPSGRCETASIQVRGRGGEFYQVACASATERFRVIDPSEGQ
jgi:Tfp pilus assembly protein FimT